MTPAEFDTWLSYHCGAFPSIADWTNRLGAVPGRAKAMLEHWQRALADTAIEDAMEITDRMAIGEIDAPLEWEQRDQTAIIVRREVAKLRVVRRKRDTVAASRPMPSRHGGMFTPLRALLTRVQTLGKSLRDGKLSKDDHDLKMEHIVHEAKKGANDQRRYRCTDCNDDGLIICWHSFSVSTLRSTGKLERSKWATMALACGGCEAGRVHWLPEAEGGRQHPTPRYDPRKHCRLVGGCGIPSENDSEELKQWLAEAYLSPTMAGEFEDWNSPHNEG